MCESRLSNVLADSALRLGELEQTGWGHSTNEDHKDTMSYCCAEHGGVNLDAL